MIISVRTTRAELCLGLVNVGFALGSPVPALWFGSQRFGDAQARLSAQAAQRPADLSPRMGQRSIGNRDTRIPRQRLPRSRWDPNRRPARPTRGRHADKSITIKYREL
jgi:hypothetical protein